MSANKKPRKKYRPRVIDAAATFNAIEGAALLDQAQVAKAVAGMREALTLFQCQVDPVFHMRVMGDTLNVAEQLIEQGICTDAESRAIVADAQAVVAQLCERHAATNSWTARSEELATLRAAIDRHEIQMQHCCMREYQAALDAVVRIVSQALHGNAGRTVITVGHIDGKSDWREHQPMPLKN